ncbi:MAG: heparinase II/III family protein [Planctomycetota bacterium]|nr:MAG: heparinase II/III family protein [Planctomycetota bacterium]
MRLTLEHLTIPAVRLWRNSKRINNTILCYSGSNTARSCYTLLVTILIGTLVCHIPCSADAPGWTVPQSHPRLLINREGVAELRVRCGIEGYNNDPAAKIRKVRFGSHRRELARLKQAAEEIMRQHAALDDLYVPAVLHLTTGQLGRSDNYTDYVTSALLDPDRRTYEMDAVVALDYCWDAIDSQKRNRIADRMITNIKSINHSEFPLNHFTFYPKLCSLAAAIVLHNDKLFKEKPAAATKLTATISLGQRYFRDSFIKFCNQRGVMPTSGQNGILEEADIVLAIEIWRTGAGQSLWPQLTDSIGRAMEHYFYADTDYPGLKHGFLHDDGTHYPKSPGRVYRGFAPAVAWAIAKNTRDPIATWFANRSLPLVESKIIPQIDRYQWVPLIYGPLNQSQADRRKCPSARNFGGGWMTMRSGWGFGETVLLFDYGQPYWRSRQHFDAGQFQIYRKGRLAIDSGDDVTYEAIPLKEGKATLAGKTGDWDHYLQATIAHNCITVADKSQVMELYGRPWPAMGNQRLIENDYNMSADDITQTKRWTGTLTVFETNPLYTYAAADLTPAYSLQTVRSINRQILFINAGAVLVLDKVTAVKSQSIKTWHLQLPARPQVFGKNAAEKLSSSRQVHGINQNAGIWEMRQGQDWLVVSHMDGRLFVRTLLPPHANRQIIGGPMKPRKIPKGPAEGKTYFGGEVLGYEHRIWPAAIKRSPNATYELGSPTSLGPHFGVGATWGRLDVSPSQNTEKVIFLHLIIPTDGNMEKPPTVKYDIRHPLAIIDIEFKDQLAHAELTLDDQTGGKVIIRHPATNNVLLEKKLSKTVQSNAELPTSTTTVE